MTRIEIYNSLGGAAYLDEIVATWSRSGCLVKEIHALDQLSYRRSRTPFERLILRWQMYGAFAFRCWRSARVRIEAEAPIRVVTTNPFFAPALVNWAGGGHGKTVNLVYDLYPDALIESGLIASTGMIARRCAAMTRRAMGQCEVSVFLGDHLREHAEARYGAAKNAVVIPVGADGSPFRSFPPTKTSSSGRSTILYAGQLGRLHDSETITEAVLQGLPPNVDVRFHASGSGVASLRNRARNRILVGEPLGQDEWRKAMAESQVALVTMSPGAEKVVMPSKTYSALVAGQAVLAVCPRESDLARLIARHDCGWVVEPGDVETLRAILQLIADSPEMLHAKRLNAFSAGHLHYDSQVLAHRWLALFDSIRTGVYS
jgi:colanic acid biosynthesis glycosyl transferase WcaI